MLFECVYAQGAQAGLHPAQRVGCLQQTPFLQMCTEGGESDLQKGIKVNDLALLELGTMFGKNQNRVLLNYILSKLNVW